MGRASAVVSRVLAAMKLGSVSPSLTSDGVLQ